MLAAGHRDDDGPEREVVTLLGAQERLSIEEWDHPMHEIVTSSDDVDECAVGRPAMVLSDVAAAEPSAQEIEDLRALAVLADVELRDELPTGSRTRVPLQGHMERSFSVDKAG
jgi:hypothetical protein